MEQSSSHAEHGWLWARVILISLLTVVWSGPLAGQEFRSSLTGQVTDPSGAVVPNALVTAVNKETKQEYSASSGNVGVYNIPYVLPGTYIVTVKGAGFKTIVQDNVLIEAAKTRGLNFRLEVGPTTQAVTVTAAPPMLETSSGSGGTVLSADIISSLPLDGRQIYMLLRTTPGSQFLQTDFSADGFSGTRGWDANNEYIIGGSSTAAGETNNFTLNGTNITVMTGFGDQGTWMTAPNIDALEETNVMDQMYDARYGRTGGGVVNMVTKNGTNEFHGDVYEYLENGVLNANTYTNNMSGTPRGKTVQNQFGGTFGGPIKKDKIFFFGSYEGYRESIPYTVVQNVPTAAMRNGDFSETPYTIYDPDTTACLSGGGLGNCPDNDYGRTAFSDNTIPSDRINAIAQKLMSYYPLPNLSGYMNNYVAPAPAHYSYNQPMGRVDYNTSEKTRWYSMFEWQRGHEYRNSSGFTGPAMTGDINVEQENWVASQDMTHMFSSTLVGDFKLSYARFRRSYPDGPLSTPAPDSIGLSMPEIPTTTRRLLPEISIDGLSSIIGNSINTTTYTNFVFDADFTKSAGRHTIEFGGEVGQYLFTHPDPGGNPNGTFSFGTSPTQYNPLNRGEIDDVTDGYGVASFLLGYPTGGAVDWRATAAETTPMWDIYAQDNIRVTRRLTVNVGLRYDVQRGLRERYNRLNRGMCLHCVNSLSNDPSYQANLAANAAELTAAGINADSLATLYGGIRFAGTDGEPRDAYNTDYTNIGPRLGFAYQINDKTVLRGGWGWMYSYGIEGGTQSGYSISTNYKASLNGGVTPTDYFQVGNPYPSGVSKPNGTSTGDQTNIGNTQQLDFPGRRIPRVQTMSLGVQRELPSHMMLDVKYAANFTRNLRDFTWLNGNLPLTEGYPDLQQSTYNSTVATQYTQQVPNPYYGILSSATDMGSSPTVSADHLMVPYSEFNLVGNYTNPVGRSWYNSLQVKLEKRLLGESRGLFFQLAYTYSRAMDEDSWRNGWPWTDAHQLHQVSPNDRAHILTWSGVWDLPMGKGAKYIAPNPPKVLGALINDWRLSWIFTAQSGTPVNIPSWYWKTTSASYRPKGGPHFGEWLDSCGGDPMNCFEDIPPMGQANQSDYLTYLRNPTVPDLDLSLMKNIPVNDRFRLQFRADAFNLTNTPLFPAPDNDPSNGPPTLDESGMWYGYGTVTFNQQNFPRIIQLSLKLIF